VKNGTAIQVNLSYNTQQEYLTMNKIKKKWGKTSSILIFIYAESKENIIFALDYGMF